MIRSLSIVEVLADFLAGRGIQARSGNHRVVMPSSNPQPGSSVMDVPFWSN